MELVPQPLGHLLRRAEREREAAGAVFDLPLAKMWKGSTLDLSRRFHGDRASTVVGPAAGPHTQLAQNIALSYLAGGRILELKTVQINDRLQIPRPCIDATNIAFNVEWSQELRIPQSRDEYAKAALLLAGLRKLGLPEGLSTDRDGAYLFDLSLGYDLKGVQSPEITGFIQSMLDASPVMERLLAELPADQAHHKQLVAAPRLVDCVTLSTFHGCPADEIELIAKYLMETYRLHMVVKLNPTLLGFDEVQGILHDQLGYRELRLLRSHFDKDLQWAQALEMIGRLRGVAQRMGVRFGVKLTNTMIVENHRSFFPATEKEMYLSGQPLHVLSTQLLGKLRGVVPLVGEGLEPPIMYSFSAGIDQHNFPAAAAADLCPVTVCTDLLRPGGYARLPKYLDQLETNMRAAGAGDVEAWILNARGGAERAMEAVLDPVFQVAQARGQPLAESGLAALRKGAARLAQGGISAAEALDSAGVPRELAAIALPLWIHRAGSDNAIAYAAETLKDPRYAKEKNAKAPKKIGSHLTLFDCVSCDKCVPVCPNDANFTYRARPAVMSAPTWIVRGDVLEDGPQLPIKIEQEHQLATYVDFCNACGNCDVFCPEDGGPYNMKPHWFGSQHAFEEGHALDGFWVPGRDEIVGRIDGNVVRLKLDRTAAAARFDDGTVELRVDLGSGAPRLLDYRIRSSTNDHRVRGDHIVVLTALLDGVLSTVNPVSATLAAQDG